MITCQPLSTVALRLKTNESDLIGFEERHWISSVRAEGS